MAQESSRLQGVGCGGSLAGVWFPPRLRLGLRILTMKFQNLDGGFSTGRSVKSLASCSHVLAQNISITNQDVANVVYIQQYPIVYHVIFSQPWKSPVYYCVYCRSPGVFFRLFQRYISMIKSDAGNDPEWSPAQESQFTPNQLPSCQLPRWTLTLPIPSSPRESTSTPCRQRIQP